MFGTDDAETAEARARVQGFDVEWTPTNTMALANDGPAGRVHPVTGVPTWHAHLAVLHESSWRDGYALAARHHERAHAYRAAWRFLARRAACAAVDALERALLGRARLGQHVTHADGGEISASDLDHFRRLAWHHTRTFSHTERDVHVIDNFKVAHARMAFEWTGARVLLASWTSGYGAERLVAAT